MARLRKTDGRFRRTTLADMGHQCCKNCGRFYPLPEPQVDENGFVGPAPKSSPCPYCGHDPEEG